MKPYLLFFTLVLILGCQPNHRIPEAFVYIPAGEFQMGSRLSPNEIQAQYGHDFTEAVKDSWEIELPSHVVHIEKSFYISKYEVTVAEFAEFINNAGYVTDAEQGIGSYSYDSAGNWTEVANVSWRNPGLWENQQNLPVVFVSWNDANEYVKWLSQKTGGTYRLPTEQEWEYACRAGSQENFTWGDNVRDGLGKINGLDGYFGFDDGFKFVAPVDSFEPNKYGLHNMLGNVWEWCSSRYVKQYPIALNEAEPSDYVDRGGGWDSPPYSARISNRGAAGAKFNTINLGFRVVLEMD
jgi:formylglycine-generating enzyme